jgi:hypothetical protein
MESPTLAYKVYHLARRDAKGVRLAQRIPTSLYLTHQARTYLRLAADFVATSKLFTV